MSMSERQALHDRDLDLISNTRFRPGAAIHNGRYLLQRLIGQGSHGRVFAAHDHERAELVALKVLRESEAASQFRLKREFRALANLRHRNLGRMHELSSEAGRLF